MNDAPMGYWRLDESTGTVAHDSVGGHDGQYLSVKLGQPGYSGKDPGYFGGIWHRVRNGQSCRQHRGN